MKHLRTFSRVIVGLVFIFSGFVKGIDPLGSAYKFHDYFLAFGMPFMDTISLGLSVFLSTAEFIIGISLLMGTRMRLTAWLVLIFMTFFTILTFIIALTNPVTDCGCFGDALIITNWQTFIKNLILMSFVLFIFVQRNKFQQFYPAYAEWASLLVAIAGFLILIYHSYQHLPPIDFRPYQVGANIPEKMKIPEGAPVDEYETLLYYEKDGDVQEFTMDNYPWDDSTWTWVETKSVLMKKGYEPPIHNFTIVSADGFDITEEVLSAQQPVFLLISHNLKEANIENLEKANAIASYCKSGNCLFYGLTASPGEVIEGVNDQVPLDFDFYFTDEVTLKTIIRSNPGLLTLDSGTITGKWHGNDIPDIAILESAVHSAGISDVVQEKNTLVWYLFFAAVVLFLTMVKYIFKKAIA